MTEGDLIDWREREGLAWAIRDMLLTASRDTQPSQAAYALLARLRDHAPADVKRAIDKQGFGIFNQVLPERAAIAETIKTMSEALARSWIADLTANKRPPGAKFSPTLAKPAKFIEGLCTGFKTALRLS